MHMTTARSSGIAPARMAHSNPSPQAIVAGQVSVGMAEMTGGAAQAVNLTSEQAQVDLADGSLWARTKEFYDLVRSVCAVHRNRVLIWLSCCVGLLTGRWIACRGRRQRFGR